MENIRMALLRRAVHHIRAQGKPSVDSDGIDFRCKYTHVLEAETLHCATWPFIVKYDNAMDSVYDSLSWNGIIRQFRENVDPLAIIHAGFVSDIQLCHDRAAAIDSSTSIDFMTQFETNIKDLCERNSDLSYESL